MGGQVLQTLRVQPPQSPADFAAYVTDPARQPDELLTLQAVAARQEGLEYLALALGELLTGQARQVSPAELQRAFEQMAEHGLPKLHQALSRFGDSGEVRAAVAEALAAHDQGAPVVRVVGADDIVVRDAATPPPAIASVEGLHALEWEDGLTMEEAERLGALLAREDLSAIVAEEGSPIHGLLSDLADKRRSPLSKIDTLETLRTHLPEIFGIHGDAQKQAEQARRIIIDYTRQPHWRRALAISYYSFLAGSGVPFPLSEVSAGCQNFLDIIQLSQNTILREMATVAYYRIVLHQLKAASDDQLENVIGWGRHQTAELKSVVGPQNQYVQYLEGEIQDKESILRRHSTVAREKAVLRNVDADLRSLGDLGAFLFALEKIVGILEDTNADLELKRMAHALLVKINRPPIDVTLTNFSLSEFFKTALGRETVPVWMIHGRSAPADELLASRDRIRVLAPKILGFLRQGPPKSEGSELSLAERLRRRLRH